MKSLVPPFAHRFDFIEFTVDGKSSALEGSLEESDFRCTQVLENALGIQKLFVRGRVRILISHMTGPSYQQEFFQHHGPGLCAIGYHVDSAKKSINLLRQQKEAIVDDFKTVEDDTMFLQTASVEGPGKIRVTLVTRSGAPHDVLAPFAPHFVKTPAAHGYYGGRALIFSRIENPSESGQVRIMFEGDEAASQLRFGNAILDF